MKKLHSNASFEKILADYKKDPSVDTLKAVFGIFELLATNIIKYFVKGLVVEEVFKNKKEIIRELVCVAFLKINRYDPEKGRAFNYFTTIMLGWLRQVYRTKKNYAELKVKYAKKLANNRSREQKVYCIRK